MDLGKYGMFTCLLNDALSGQLEIIVVFEGWVVDNLVVIMFVVASTVYLFFYHYLPLPLPVSSFPWKSSFHLKISYW